MHVITGKSAAASLGGAGTNCRYPIILTKKGFILVKSLTLVVICTQTFRSVLLQHKSGSSAAMQYQKGHKLNGIDDNRCVSNTKYCKLTYKQ